MEEERSRLLGAGRPPNTYLSLDGKTIVYEPKIRKVSWNDVEKARKEGGMLVFRIARDRGGPFVGQTAIKDGKYVPMPAVLDKEWIEYIKRGQVPPLLGAVKHVYPPPRFGFYSTDGMCAIMGVFRHGKWWQDNMMSGVYECWFDQTNQEEISKALIYMRKLNKVYLKFLRERIPGFENAYIVMESSTAGTREGRRIVGEYTLTEDDELEGRKFPDVIAKGGHHGPDAHSVTGTLGRRRALLLLRSRMTSRIGAWSRRRLITSWLPEEASQQRPIYFRRNPRSSRMYVYG